MTRKKKPQKHQQFTISAEKTGHMVGQPKKKPKQINQFTDAERKEFEAKRKEGESTWSKIDRATIDKQCENKEVWEE